jgi:hypothetical protein
MPVELPTLIGLLADCLALNKASKEVLRVRSGDLAARIANHVMAAFTWSGRVQVFGMPAPVNTEDFTVPLMLNATPRRFLGSDGSAQFSEQQIVEHENNIMIVGDPGSGKTTAVKRLLRWVVINGPSSDSDRSNFPVLIVAREIKAGSGLVRAIAEELGIPYEYRRFESDDDLGGHERGDYYYQNQRLENVVADFLNESRALLFVDGIDEVDPNMKKLVEYELTRLARGGSLKVIATSRSGDLAAFNVEGFRLVEIAPLVGEDISRIAEQWATEPAAFLFALANKPYKDAATRPLFLVQLILVHNRKRRLPARAVEVYQKIIAICLELWDDERRIVRASSYKGFSSDRKLDFLAALAYRLTYVTKRKQFSHVHLLETYQAICDQFGLPKSEAEAVCAEVESHTGIIVRTYDEFEFSHLSLQEYLCAYHMVRLPFDQTMGMYLMEYPAPIAVAVSLSSDPSAWLSALVYHTREFNAPPRLTNAERRLTQDVAFSFFSRLVLEEPLFSRSFLLGLALLRLFSAVSALDVVYGPPTRPKPKEEYAHPVIATLRDLLKSEAVIGSISDVFDRYYFDPIENLMAGDDIFILHRGLGSYEKFIGRLPGEIRVKQSVIRFLAEEYRMTFSWWTAEETRVRGDLPFLTR